MVSFLYVTWDGGRQLDDPGWSVETNVAENSGRPNILVRLGSTFQNQAAVYRRIVDALAGMEVDATVTLDDVFDPAGIPSPANVRILRSAPHSALLPSVDLVVTHGGQGTVIRTLAAGVPMVVIPLGRDQFDNGARVEVGGAGVTPKPSAGQERIREAIESALGDPSIRAGAARLGSKIRIEAEEDAVVAEVEALL